MVEETEENWRENVRKTIEMSPDSVTIYEMEIPYNTTIYKQMKAEGKLVAPVADWETKRGWVITRSPNSRKPATPSPALTPR